MSALDQLNIIVAQIATFLKIANIDVYILFFVLLFVWILIFIWTKTIYESLFWLILWLSIFIVLHFLLLNNQCTNWCINEYLDIKLLNFIVWTSSYLIFILSIIVPLYWWISFRETKNIYLKYIFALFLSIFFIIFYSTIIIWFIEKTYIFKINSFFMFFNNFEWFKIFKNTSKIYQFLLQKIQLIVVLWVFFTFYKLLFSELINSMFAWLIKYLKEKKAEQDAQGWWWESWWEE